MTHFFNDLFPTCLITPSFNPLPSTLMSPPSPPSSVLNPRLITPLLLTTIYSYVSPFPLPPTLNPRLLTPPLACYHLLLCLPLFPSPHPPHSIPALSPPPLTHYHLLLCLSLSPSPHPLHCQRYHIIHFLEEISPAIIRNYTDHC